MTGSQLALVADDQRFASTVQAQLKKALGWAGLLCSYPSSRNHLVRDAEGVLALLVNSANDSENALRLV